MTMVSQSVTTCLQIILVRCFTCGKVIGDKWNTYLELLANDMSGGYASTPLPTGPTVYWTAEMLWRVAVEAILLSSYGVYAR